MRYSFKTKPYPHQRRALRRLLKQRGGGLQVPMRWGKTKVAIDFANCLHLMEGLKQVLVICPLSVVGVWEQEIPKHTPDGIDLTWRVINFDRVYDRIPYDSDEGGWFPGMNLELENYVSDQDTLVVVDESHHIGNPEVVISQYCYRLGRLARFRLIMTGTMFHRKPFFTFGQAKFYDPAVFGSSFASFKKKIAVMGGYGGYEVLRYVNLGWMMKRMKKWVYIEKDVPPRDDSVTLLRFHLTGEGLAQYVQMEKESIIEVGGEEVISPIILSRHLRCQQIAGGWVKTDTRYRRVGKDKYNMAQARFQQYADADIEKFVVGCRFIPEIRDAAYAAKKAGYRPILFHGALKKEERTRRIKDFQESSDRCAFISQISTGAEGISLAAASVMMFYSLPESYVQFDQFRNRIYVWGDKDRVCQYDYLVAWGTRDQVTYESTQLKQDVADFIAKDPAYVEQITMHASLKQGSI